MNPLVVSILLFGIFVLLIIVRVPVSFALGLACIPFFLYEDRLSPFVLIYEMWASYNSFILLAVPLFLLAANLMNAAGITDRLIDFSKALVGHLPGGLGHINVMVSMLFAGISGSSTADAAGIGSLLIPSMKKQGYDSSFSVAITACTSVLGVIIPPSIPMIVWGGVMSVSIGGLFLAGVVPGILMALSMMGTVYVYARKRKYPIHQRSSIKEFLPALRKAIPALIAPAIVVGGIIGGIFTPTEASVVAVIYSAFLGCFVFRTIRLKDFSSALTNSARLASVSLFCIGTASAFATVLAYYKIPEVLQTWVLSIDAGIILTGFLIALAFLVIGMFIDPIPAIIIVGTIFKDVAEGVGMHPIHFAIIGVISLAFGLVTPPYGLCLLISARIGEIRVIDALRDVLVILAPMLLLLVVVIVFPQLVLALPRWIKPDFL